MQDGSNKGPLVSVIIPAYNAGAFIKETINSVLAQTYRHWELIVVNDGSGDNTADLVKDLIEKDTRISLISKSNSGVSDTRNKGMEQAKGELIAFLDADDVWLPDNLEKKVSTLAKDPSLGFVYSHMWQADKDLQNRTMAPLGKDNNILDDLLMWNGEVIPGPCSNLVIRRKCFEEGVRFDPRLTTIADQNFTVQLAYKYKGRLIPEALWVYRILPGSMSKSLQVMEQDSLATYSIYGKKGYFRSKAFQKKCFANMYLILSGSWLKDGKQPGKAFNYFLKALAQDPAQTIKGIFSRLSKRFN
jgi:glycosyltransferase involved in cell wall biosynthesis